jgi:hypothetical protein
VWNRNSRIRRVEAGETAVAEDSLRPRDRRTGRLERTVVLRPALHVLRVRRVHRQALELKCLQAVVQVWCTTLERATRAAGIERG